MKNKQFEIPILFIIFNRPETEQKVFDIIRKIRPKHLYISADGPRNEKGGEFLRTIEARKIVDDGIDWPCRVYKLYRKGNIGCKLAVSSAIDWFFENVDEGIILEDDCLPDITFFNFCSDLLRKYKNNKKVLIISGDNFQDGNKRGKGSYYFSKYTHIWGWATWKNRWQKYNVDMKDWPSVKRKGSIKYSNFLEHKYWEYIFDRVYSGSINTWDYQLLYLSLKKRYLNIIPKVNLVENIGMGVNATHTTKKSIVPTKNQMNFPLVHCATNIDNQADRYTMEHHYKINLSNLLLGYIKYIWKLR